MVLASMLILQNFGMQLNLDQQILIVSRPSIVEEWAMSENLRSKSMRVASDTRRDVIKKLIITIAGSTAGFSVAPSHAAATILSSIIRQLFRQSLARNYHPRHLILLTLL